MATPRWLIAALATTTVAATALYAWERGWLPGRSEASAGVVARALPSPAVVDAEKNARLRKLTDDLAIAHSALGQAEGEIAAMRSELGRAREESGMSRADLDVTISALRDLQRRLVPGDDSGNDLAKLVGWVTTALGRTVEERDDARRESETSGRHAQELDEALSSERATHQRHQTEAESNAQALRQVAEELQSALQTAQGQALSAQNESQVLRSRVEALVRNNSLRVHITGDPIFIEWALVFYKDSDADIRVREMSYTAADEGWKVYSGEDFDFGEGLAVVFLCEKIGEPERTLTYYATVWSSGSGTFNLDYHW